MNESGKRNLAADVFRGLGLWILFIDHLQPNFWAHFTPAQFGFSDFAEIFVFFSGYINALMYERALQSGGFAAGIRKLRTRLVRLYFAHVATMAASIAILALFAVYGVRLGEPVLYLWESAPWEYAWRTLVLLYAPHWYSLLPLYIALAPFTVLAVYTLRRWPGASLTASFAVWCLAQLSITDFGVMTRQEAWYFRPLAWQWMAVMGAATAMYWMRVREAAQSRPARFSAWAVVAGVFAVKAAALAPSVRDRILEHSSLLAHDAGKARLAPFRLLHFLSLAVLAISVPWNESTLLESRFVRLAASLGRDSLFIYCLTLILSLVMNLFLAVHPGGPLLQLACTLVGLGAMTGIAVLRYSRKSLEKDQRRSGIH